jgi:hypothetical protein
VSGIPVLVDKGTTKQGVKKMEELLMTYGSVLVGAIIGVIIRIAWIAWRG